MVKAQEFAMEAVARTKQIGLEVALMNAKAKLTMAERWNGQLPEKMMPENANIMFRMD
jgi:hypothetical protein